MGKIFDALEKAGLKAKETPAAAVPQPTVDKVVKPMPIKGTTNKKPLSAPENGGPDDAAQTVKPVEKMVSKTDLKLPDIKKDRQIRSVPQEKTAGVVEPAAAPHKGPLNRNLVSMFKPQSIEAEQFKILKTNILFPASGKPPRTILVTSALPNEGKSFVSSNLAISVAQNISDHVLLIDCDLRLPTIHSLFGYDQVPGLSEYLKGDSDLSSYLLKTDIDKLTILPAGAPPPNPAELLTSGRMSDLIQEVSRRYEDRYIIIDSPPPQLSAEASAIARAVDGVIIVVKYKQTPREMIADLVGMIGKEKILGVIFNWFNLRSSKLYGHVYGKYDRYHEK